jgi:hypothetical protein
MRQKTLAQRIRARLAGWCFRLAGMLDPAYDVWLDTAVARTRRP